MAKKPRLTKKFWYGYFGAFSQLRVSALNKINEFEKIKKTKNTNEIDLFLIKQVFMDSIVLDMAKILGVTRSDQTGIENIVKRLSSKKFAQLRKKLEKTDKKYKSVKAKIKENRSRIIGHLDFQKRPYYNLKFSSAEIERIYETPPDLVNHVFGSREEYEAARTHAREQLVSNQERNQRYSQIDMNKDIPTFRTIIRELEDVFYKINLLVCNQKKSLKQICD